MHANQPFVAHAHECSEFAHTQGYSEFSDPFDVIVAIEEELQEQGTSILDELYGQRDLYLDELNTASSDRQTNILMILDTIDEAILRFEQRAFELFESTQNNSKSIGNSNNNSSNITSMAVCGISPNCTCNWLNYFLDSPCGNCIVWGNTMDAVIAIAAGFSTRGWSLAADLIWFNISNTTVDYHYWPSLGNRIATSTQIADVAASNKLVAPSAQTAPGWANGIFANTIDGDTYNSLGSFWYSKTGASNDNVTISVIDRYDWTRGPNSSGGIFNNTMATAQDIGLVTPFYTRINVTVAGYVSFNWEYTSSGVAITGAQSGTTVINNIPSQIYDLRVNPRDNTPQPMVNVTSIGASAFAGMTSLTQITIPASVTHIGADAFINTNNASIYLDGRTSVPSTFSYYWNSSGNPVYLNGNQCMHTSKNTIELNATQHGDLCNHCRTVTNIMNHRKYTSGNWERCYDCSYSKDLGHTHTYTYTWLDLKQHESSCSCGYNRVTAHIVSGDWNGQGYTTCLSCGGLADSGFIIQGIDPSLNMIGYVPHISQYFGNGSFMLNNGVIVLSELDLIKYYDGTLILPYECEGLNCCSKDLDLKECCGHTNNFIDEFSCIDFNTKRVDYLPNRREEYIIGQYFVY